MSTAKFRKIGNWLLILPFILPSAAVAGPTISGVSSAGINKSSVLITWNTDTAADSQVEYGTTALYGKFSGLDATPATLHSVQLDGLTPLTLYHYKVKSSDGGGYLSESKDYVFFLIQLAWDAPDWIVGRYLVSYGNASKSYNPPQIDVGTSLTYTLSISDPGAYYFAVKAEYVPGFESDYSNEVYLAVETVATFILSVQAKGVTANQATIEWITDPAADSRVEYGKSPTYENSTNLDSAYVIRHSRVLDNLADGTVYHYRVKSSSASGVGGVSGDFTFSTSDTIPPVISSVANYNITDTGATIAWVTDEYADTQVEYGPTAAYGQSTSLDSSLAKVHTVDIRGLTINTIYHYRVRSTDIAGNLAVSGDRTFTTAFLPVPSDFSSDTRSDILVRNPLTGEISMWFSDGSAFTSHVSLAFVPDLSWKIAGIGDFNGDGKPDVLWRHYGLGENFIWFMNGMQYFLGSYIDPQRDMDY
jgi:hypothetical protein